MSTLKQITSALIKLQQKVELIGIIYLHPITGNRMHGAAAKSLKILRGFCGEAAYKFIMLATTMWKDKRGLDRVLEDRDFEMQHTRDLWGKMIEKGSMPRRHYNSRDSAEDIITDMLTNYSLNKPFIPQIYTEMEVEHKDLEATVAGMELVREVHSLRQQLEQKMRDLITDHKRAIRQRDDQIAAEMAEEKAMLTEQLRQKEQAMDELRVSSDEAARETRAEHQREIERLREKCEEANQRMKEFEEQLRHAREEIEKNKLRYDQEAANYKKQIEALNENQRQKAERGKAGLARKAEPPDYDNVMVQKQQELKYQRDLLKYQRDLFEQQKAEYYASKLREHELQIWHQQAAQVYNQHYVACCGHSAVVNILNVNILNGVNINNTVVWR